MAFQSMPVLVAPGPLSAKLRAPAVAAAIGRGLERAGVHPLPDLCPVAGGGHGTIEVLLPVLGGETGDGFALVEDGGTALVEHGGTGAQTGSRIAGAIGAGVEVVVLCGDAGDGAGIVEAIEDAGGLRGSALVVLCETGVVAAGELAVALHSRYRAALVPGPAFVLEQLGFDARMRAARAVVVGEARLDRATLGGRVAGEIAIRARQAGVPCHSVVADNAIGRFDVRILDLQEIVEAGSIAELEAAGERVAAGL